MTVGAVARSIGSDRFFMEFLVGSGGNFVKFLAIQSGYTESLIERVIFGVDVSVFVFYVIVDPIIKLGIELVPKVFRYLRSGVGEYPLFYGIAKRSIGGGEGRQSGSRARQIINQNVGYGGNGG